MANLKKLELYIDKHKYLIQNQKLKTIPLVINAYGGPGSGKSTTCLHLVAELKKIGYKAEYVSEYAKELVYDNNYELLDGSLEHQIDILLEQNKRVERLVGNVDFIVSDSPIFLSPIYVKEQNDDFTKLVKELDSHYNTFTFFVERNKDDFKTEGRIHNLDESIVIDEKIKTMLSDNNIYYGKYNHNTVDKIIPNCIKTFNRINNLEIDPILSINDSFIKKNEVLSQLEDLKVHCDDMEREEKEGTWKNYSDALVYAIKFLTSRNVYFNFPKEELKEKGGKKI